MGSSGVTIQLDGLTVVAPLFLSFVGLLAIKFFRGLDLKFELTHMQSSSCSFGVK